MLVDEKTERHYDVVPSLSRALALRLPTERLDPHLQWPAHP